MKIAFRRLAGLTLALTIALTSVTMALARGQTRDAAGIMIICSGAGVVSVSVDADGDPVGPVHICPDCALGALAWVDIGSTLSLPDRAEFRLSFVSEHVSVPGLGWSAPRARGPPLA